MYNFYSTYEITNARIAEGSKYSLLVQRLQHKEIQKCLGPQGYFWWERYYQFGNGKEVNY